jgi:hypothetical protein
MDEKEFDALSIRAAICPGLETSWPKAETTHGLALHRAANELRDRRAMLMTLLSRVEIRSDCVEISVSGGSNSLFSGKYREFQRD